MGLIENAKDAAKLVQQIGNIELYEKLVSLQQDAMSILDENWKLKEEVRHLKEQLRQREGISELASDMEYDQDAGFYIRKSEKAAGKTIPYCPICWKSDKKDIPLNPQSGKGAYRCNIHNSIYATQARRQEDSRSFFGGSTPRSPWS